MTRQIILTCVVLACVVLLFAFTDFDIVVQDTFFNFELKQWIVDRDDGFAKLVFYDGAKNVFYVFIATLLAGLLFFRHTQLIQSYKRGFLIVCLSAISVPLAVSSLKIITNIPCPKNIFRYDGNYPYVTLLSKRPDNYQHMKKMRCFPAGHASGGFALLSLFFLFEKRKNKIIAFSSAMIVGWSTGMYKVLIGDHFISHTIVTMILAWLIILLIVNSTLGIKSQ